MLCSMFDTPQHQYLRFVIVHVEPKQTMTEQNKYLLVLYSVVPQQTLSDRIQNTKKRIYTVLYFVFCLATRNDLRSILVVLQKQNIKLNFFLILYFVFCILYFVFCILYFVFCILYFVFCILYFVFCTLYFVLCAISYLVERQSTKNALF